MKEHGAKQKDRNDGRGEKEGGDGWIEGKKKKQRGGGRWLQGGLLIIYNEMPLQHLAERSDSKT